MVHELDEMGVKVMVSVWPTVNQHSEHCEEMLERELLIRAERGSAAFLPFQDNWRIYQHDFSREIAGKNLADLIEWERCTHVDQFASDASRRGTPGIRIVRGNDKLFIIRPIFATGITVWSVVRRWMRCILWLAITWPLPNRGMPD